MTRIAHLSDLHFGREDPVLVTGLLTALAEAAPTVIVVSGDLTQRAKKLQFRHARAFLDAMPQVPRLVVPGNHDVSTTNIYERMAHPMRRYKRFITKDMEPFLIAPKVAIAGIDTVRVLNTKDGRLNRQQVARACERLTAAGTDRVRIVVTHHPIDLPLEDTKHARVTRATKAMAEFAACGVDLFLSGHLHTGQTISTSLRYKIAGHSALVIHAGTAISTRTRNEPNSWNLLDITATEVTITRMIWNESAFTPQPPERYRKTPEGWLPTS
jgi:3',5'-cyclic AMP phosphodiesterase CpdA